MSKIKISVYLSLNGQIIINDKKEAIFIDNKIKYQDDCINILDINNCVLKRTNTDYSIYMDFKNSLCKYIYSNSYIPIDINIIKKEVKSNYFCVHYMLDNSKFYIYIVEVIL